MCTILAGVGVWPERPLVIAANRDEKLARPAQTPQVFAAGALAERRVLAPRDLAAGGTWLGLNDAGVFVGITNRFTGKAGVDASRRSRGELVFAALAGADHVQAEAAVAALRPADYNPFHLLMADREGAKILWSDGQRFTRLTLEPGIHWITERSFGAGPSARHDRLRGWARTLRAGPVPSVEGWRGYLGDHQGAALSSGLDAMCVHAPALGYGTRSSTLVYMGRGAPRPESVTFWHAPGRPCEHAFEPYEDEVRRLFAGE
ncbi:NRDE family protein [Pseudenhygromyxa sp. WMMC2535]|uniref:NRDE family protein n=1 Tax=Pseudenhygromyxa sp. WMMC2535 TaxID=2712867 RepID=UPI001555127F|nr:NRDE family protein [Pseudenhygromyxa sp. WMMC2535]NVB42670.1 NRDE family protein [Pseudenhygromyxa sp. WMMC2535]